MAALRLGDHSSYTRIVFDFKGKTAPSLSPELTQKAELRVDVNASVPSTFKLPKKAGLVESVAASGTKFVFKTVKPLKVLKAFSIPPTLEMPHYRYVIDIQVNTEKTPLSFPTKKLKTIIIDAGHGGEDPGALARSRGGAPIQEKKITLEVAQRLAKKLNETGRYKCILTRDQDVFVRLGHRLKKGREHKGDFFISFHADSHPCADTRGLAIYTLSSVASDKEAERLAQKENKADLIMGTDLQGETPEVANILIDLTKRETMNLSIKAASTLIKKLGRHVLLLRNPHRSANFKVLRSADLPAILIELGYISNDLDLKLLVSPSHQEKICDGIIEGLTAYFSQNSA